MRLKQRALVALLGTIAVCSLTACKDVPRADPTNAAQVGSGKIVYGAHCAVCHGATRLEIAEAERTNAGAAA